jgi:hypothetical protein
MGLKMRSVAMHFRAPYMWPRPRRMAGDGDRSECNKSRDIMPYYIINIK